MGSEMCIRDRCKTPSDVWGTLSGEERMHIWRNHLVSGCVDKAMFGKHGLLHVFHVGFIFDGLTNNRFLSKFAAINQCLDFCRSSMGLTELQFSLRHCPDFLPRFCRGMGLHVDYRTWF